MFSSATAVSSFAASHARGEPLAQAAEPVDVLLAGDAGRVREAVPRQEALHEADVTQAFGIRLELVPGVEEGDREGGAVARLEGSLRHRHSLETSHARSPRADDEEIDVRAAAAPGE